MKMPRLKFFYHPWVALGLGLLMAASMLGPAMAREQAQRASQFKGHHLLNDFWQAPFLDQCAFLGQHDFLNTLGPAKIRLVGHYLHQRFLTYLQQNPDLAAEVEGQLIQKPGQIQKLHPYETTRTLTADQEKSLPPRTLVQVKLKKLEKGKSYTSPLAQYLKTMGSPTSSDYVAVIFDGELGFKHYQGYFSSSGKAMYFSPTVFGQILAAPSLLAIGQIPTVAHEEFHRRQAQMVRQNTATLTSGIAGTHIKDTSRAIQDLTNNAYQQSFYLEETFAHALSLRLQLQELQAYLTAVAPQDNWPTAGINLRFNISKRFWRCFGFTLGAWRLNTYLYHAFPAYFAAAEKGLLDDPSPQRPFIAEDDQIYLPVTHTFAPTEQDSSSATPSTHTYYYTLPVAVLANAQVKPYQRITSSLVLDLANLRILQEFVRQQNAYFQTMAITLNQMWQIWRVIYSYSPTQMRSALASLLELAQQIPWPRPFPPGWSPAQQHQVPAAEQIDELSAKLLDLTTFRRTKIES